MDDVPSKIDLFPRQHLSRSNGPLYRQLAEMIRAAIADGTFPVGSELPKEATIAEHYGVSMITVRQALRDLEADGLVRKRSAKPAVVAARRPASRLGWSFRNFAEIAAAAGEADLKVKSYRREKSPVFERQLGLGKAASGYCLRGVLVLGDQKRSHITSYFPPDVGALLKRRDFCDTLIFRSVQNRLGIRLEVAQVTVRAEIADAAMASDLDIDVGGPLLTIEMLYKTADQRAIEFTVARHPAEIMHIAFDAPNDMP